MASFRTKLMPMPNSMINSSKTTSWQYHSVWSTTLEIAHINKYYPHHASCDGCIADKWNKTIVSSKSFWFNFGRRTAHAYGRRNLKQNLMRFITPKVAQWRKNHHIGYYIACNVEWRHNIHRTKPQRRTEHRLFFHKTFLKWDRISNEIRTFTRWTEK